MYVTRQIGDATLTLGVCGDCVEAVPDRCARHPVTDESKVRTHQIRFAVDGETYSLPVDFAIAVKRRAQ